MVIPWKPLARISFAIQPQFCIAFNYLLRHVGFDRRHIRRQKQSRAESALLVNVVHDLRMPDVVNLVYGDLRLDLREGIPVAVVIVAHVLLIKLRRIGAFIRRAECFVVPVFDNVNTVRIQGGNQQDDRVMENF